MKNKYLDIIVIFCENNEIYTTLKSRCDRFNRVRAPHTLSSQVVLNDTESFHKYAGSDFPVISAIFRTRASGLASRRKLELALAPRCLY